MYNRKNNLTLFHGIKLKQSYNLLFRHAIIPVIILCFFLLSCGSKNSGENEENNKPKNILFIAVDDLRPELNFYGAQHIKSPNLDKLASESLVFDRAYCNIAVCGASRASILTGVRPTRKRFVGYSTKKDVDAPELTSIPMTFKQNGYTTISNGKVYHHGKDDSMAWDEIWHPSPGGRDYLNKENIDLDVQEGVRGRPFESMEVEDADYMDGKTANKAINDLKSLKIQDKPFFLAVGFLKPHLPFNAPTKYWDMYKRSDIKLPENYVQPSSTPSKAFHNSGELRSYYGVPKEGEVSEQMAKELIHGYYACVSYVDAQIGLVLDELQASGMAENTIVVLWGDHGWNLGDHKIWCKHSTFASSVRTPLLIKVSGQTNGKHTDAITEYIDIYPSLCELAGIEAPSHLEGESIVPLLHGKSRMKNYAVSKYQEGVVLIRDNYFYSEWTNDKGEAYARMLFDHAADPMEMDNLAEKEEHKDLVRMLGQELREKWGKNYLD